MVQYFGGTNFGRTSGGPFYITSYDYDAPIDEYGMYFVNLFHASMLEYIEELINLLMILRGRLNNLFSNS